MKTFKAAMSSKAQHLLVNEDGDAIQAIAVGAVGILLSAVIFTAMSGVINNNLSPTFGGWLGSVLTKGNSIIK